MKDTTLTTEIPFDATDMTHLAPYVGEIVVVNLSTGEAPAVVTKVWSPSTVNVSVFDDGNPHATPITSVPFLAEPLPDVLTWRRPQ